MSRSLVLVFIAPALLLAWGCTEPPSESDFQELARASLSELDGEIVLDGLGADVEVLRDRWGIPHIYAHSLEDLFFAQGFVIAQDRLWQMELWRRWSEGRVAEILGERGVAHDRLVRLLKFRGPWDEREFGSYHPEGRRIFTAYAAGINAFIEHRRDDLPVEFVLTGIVPEPWSAEILLSRARVGAVVREAQSELRLARAVHELGAEEANRREAPDPFRELIVPDGLDVSLISEEAIAALEGDMYPEFPRPELLPQFRDRAGAPVSTNTGARETQPGSNNWGVRPELTATGSGFMVDDPHRQVTLPAHRYIVHLVAPGWNVIGATEPTLPGVFRGHNGRLAWGRTASGSDQADVFVEELSPDDPMQVLHAGEWEPLEVIEDVIRVKGRESPLTVEIKLSRHGPIFFEDRERHLAYALRSKLQQPGTAEYLGGLRLDQAQSVEECLEQAAFVINPPTNLVCADADGNVGWTIGALSPKRTPGWDGRLPVPGTGGYGWLGFRDDLPRRENPAEGFIATANNNTHPPDYDPPLFFRSGAPRYRRYERIHSVLSRASALSGNDMRELLNDTLNTEALELRPFFHGWQSASEPVESAREEIAEWDARMAKESRAAAIYWHWRESADRGAVASAEPGARPALVEAALEVALAELEASQGTDRSQWRWGRIHRTEFPHPLSSTFDLESVERDGGAGTVNATGAVYRLITDFSDLDRSLAIIAPGQSGQPESPYYDNLTEMWVRGEMFELPYSRAAVESSQAHRLVLRPE